MGQETEQRDAHGRLKKGVILNPNGRPAGSKSFTSKVRDALSKISAGGDTTYEEEFIKAILKKAIVDQDPQIMKLMWNYFDGMPTQPLDHTSLGRSMNPLAVLTDEELDDEIDRIERELEGGEVTETQGIEGGETSS